MTRNVLQRVASSILIHTKFALHTLLVATKVEDGGFNDESPVLGEWECNFCVGVVQKENKAAQDYDPNQLKLYLFEPWQVDDKGEPQMPLWLHARTQSARAVDTSWEAVVKLPWKRIRALPFDYAEALHVAEHGTPYVEGSSVSRTFMKKQVEVVKITGRNGYMSTQPRERCVHVISTTPAERAPNGVIRFDEAISKDLAELAALVD